MKTFYTEDIKKTDRIGRLVENLYKKMPEIEADRAVLLTESYRKTEGEPIILRRAKAFAHILENIPITIRDEELIVGSATQAPRGCQTFPEYSFEWLEAEFDTVETRAADPFYISEQTKAALREGHEYWKGKTTSERATAYMAPEALAAIDHNIFTPGNYFYNGIGHVCVQYDKVLKIGYRGIITEAKEALAKLDFSDAEYIDRVNFLEAVIESCEAVIEYARRYSRLARELAGKETNPERRRELEIISKNCARVPEFPATSFYEACQTFWFIQLLLQVLTYHKQQHLQFHYKYRFCQHIVFVIFQLYQTRVCYP